MPTPTTYRLTLAVLPLRLLACAFDIDRWMSSNRLKLNAEKTEFIWLGTRQQLAKVDMSLVQLKDQLVMPLDKVRDLGVILDSRLNMEAHVANVIRSSLYSISGNYDVSGVL